MQAQIETNNHTELHKRFEVKLKRELGDAVLAALADPRTEDIVLNPDSTLWSKCAGEGFRRIGSVTPADARSALSTIATSKGTVLNYDNPILETELSVPGEPRFEGLVEPVVRNPSFAIRMRPRIVYTLEQYEEAGILSYKDDPLNAMPDSEDFLDSVRGCTHHQIIDAGIVARKNFLLVGATGTGKTTLGNAGLEKLARLCPDDRTILIEDTAELQCRVKNYVALHSVSHVSMLRCLMATLRLKPDRIIVGEVRDECALALLEAWNTGHPGGMATVHADNAYLGLVRLESLVARSTHAPPQKLIAEAVNIVVFIGAEPRLAAHRKVKQVAYVTGYADGRYQLEYL